MENFKNTGDVPLHDVPLHSDAITQVEEPLLALTKPIFSQDTRTKRDQIFLFSIAAVVLALGLQAEANFFGVLKSISPKMSVPFLSAIVGYLLYSYWIDVKADLHHFEIRTAVAKEKLVGSADALQRLSKKAKEQADQNKREAEAKAEELKIIAKADKDSYDAPEEIYKRLQEKIDAQLVLLEEGLKLDFEQQERTGQLLDFIRIREKIYTGAMQVANRYKRNACLEAWLLTIIAVGSLILGIGGILGEYYSEELT